MRRGSLLAALPAAVGVAGCSSLSTPEPEVRMESGIGHLDRSDQLQIAHGIQPDGDDQVYTTVAPVEVSDLVTDATDPDLADTLSNDGGDVFTLVLQPRSTPEAPMSISLEPFGDVRIEGNTLHADVTVEPWGSLDEDDEAVRNADELVYTSVWNLTPEPRSLPEQVDLHLWHRG